MIKLQGKYNTCKVFTDNADNTTISQITELLNMPYMTDCQTRIMPDCHAGTGCVVGTTIKLKDKVVPNLVGVDIGCGVFVVKLNTDNFDLHKLDKVINEHVPSGFNIHDEPRKRFNLLNEILCDVNIDNAEKSIGTLGGGNHFIEVDKDNDGNLYLVIHSGSRHLGIEVCKYYQDIAIKSVKKGNISNISEVIAKMKSEGREKEIEATIKAIKEQTVSIPKDLCYIEGEDFKAYIHDMDIAQQYAKLNRRTIADIILDNMELSEDESFDTIHNYINPKDNILRKGAISAYEGEKVIIPMNMRDGSLICVGKSNADWNFSAPHGAGRILSRSEAKEHLDMVDFEKSMNGIYSTSVVESTIDEAPMAYKPMDEIIKNIGDTVDIINIIKPIYNFKAH